MAQLGSFQITFAQPTRPSGVTAVQLAVNFAARRAVNAIVAETICLADSHELMKRAIADVWNERAARPDFAAFLPGVSS